jgi:hypothetical protein
MAGALLRTGRTTSGYRCVSDESSDSSGARFSSACRESDGRTLGAPSCGSPPLTRHAK